MSSTRAGTGRNGPSSTARPAKLSPSSAGRSGRSGGVRRRRPLAPGNGPPASGNGNAAEPGNVAVAPSAPIDGGVCPLIRRPICSYVSVVAARSLSRAGAREQDLIRGARGLKSLEKGLLRPVSARSGPRQVGWVLAAEGLSRSGNQTVTSGLKQAPRAYRGQVNAGRPGKTRRAAGQQRGGDLAGRGRGLDAVSAQAGQPAETRGAGRLPDHRGGGPRGG